MRRSLPSLTALLTFEVSARLLSFKRAAAELGVSEAAVSRQIRNLEDHIGVPLFHRLHRRVELSDAGQRLFEPVNRGFSDMASAVSSLQQATGERQVTVGATGAFAFFWLMPRLGRFSETWSDITVNQVVTDEPVDLQSGTAELAIRYGGGAWSGLDSRFLFRDVIYPVCSPGYLESVRNPLEPADLLTHPLYDAHGIDGDEWIDWPAWFRLIGAPVGAVRVQYLNYLIGVQMALDGKGFVLGWDQFVAPMIANGRLVKPLDQELVSPGAFYLTYPSGRSLSQEAQVFADWLVQETQAEAASSENGGWATSRLTSVPVYPSG